MEKCPLPEAQRKFEGATLHHTGKQAQHRPTELFQTLFKICFTEASKQDFYLQTYKVSWGCFPFCLTCTERHTTLLAEWLGRPPQEWHTRVRFPLLSVGIFTGLSRPRDLTTGTPMVTLPSAWRDRVSTGSGWPSIHIP